jgi:opacity protein-like surface antigen
MANDISLSSRTPYNELESKITLTIPQDANIKTGDWLAFTIYERIRQRYYQVPIGLEYFHGRGRLQWQLQGGALLNKVVFDDYLLKAWVESKSEGLPIDKVKVITKVVPSKNYAGVYAGIGLNFQVTEHWHTRAGMTYNYDFINNNKTGISNSQLIGSAFRLGLNYRF